MIAHYPYACGCPSGGCQIHGGWSSVTISSTGNQTQTQGSPESYRNYRQSPLELEREWAKFDRLSKWKPPRLIVKVDEKRLITKPVREHAKPHQASSSRAAMSVRQFAQRVK